MGQGYCTIGGHVVTEATTPQQCAEINGTWHETGGSGGGGGGGGDTDSCFVRNILTRSLGDTLLWLGTTYEVPIRIRDDVMMRTEFGREMVELYYASIPELFRIAKQDPRLLGECLHAWVLARPVAEAVLRAQRNEEPGKRERYKSVRVSRRLYEQCGKVLEILQGRATDPTCIRFLDICAAQLERYRDLTAAEVLVVFKQSAHREVRKRTGTVKTKKAKPKKR